MKTKILLVFLIIIFAVVGCKKESKYEEMGEYAPPDAYENGNKHPFYGSENEWNQRFFYDHIKDYYKRRGQRQILDISEGRSAEAEVYCRELIAQDTNDLESRFNLAVALANQNKIPDAMQVIKDVVKRGLPLGRFLAGPRNLLKPLTDSKEFKTYEKGFNVEILHGPMLGRVTDHSASFWVRTADEINVQVRLSADKNLTSYIESNTVKSKADVDYTAIVTTDNLRPNTEYYYKIYVNGKAAPGTDLYSFKTYPEENKPAKFEIAFGGCAGYVYWNERIWDVIHNHNPLAFLWLGDNVYINEPTFPGAIHYYTYYRRQSGKEYRNFVSSTANYAIWDDHDAATDDIWMGPYKDRPAWKMPLLDNFEENWINPFYGTNDWPGTYFNFKIGDVEIFMLDVRFYRTNPYDENPTMLGPAQKAWLLDQLKKSTATFKIMASGVPWAYDAKEDSKDTWNGFRSEREEIFNFLADNNINGVLLLSGDRHRTDIRKIERDNGYTMYDFENCKLTNQHTAPYEPGAIFEYNEKNTYSLLTFDTSQPDPVVVYKPMTIDDEVLYTMTLKLSDLSQKD